MKLTISGHSDDIIMVCGSDGRCLEEFSGWDSGKPSLRYLAFSDGTLLSICYTEEGVWRILPVRIGSVAYFKKEAVSHDSKEYSDIVTLEGEISWVVYSLTKPKFTNHG